MGDQQSEIRHVFCFFFCQRMTSCSPTSKVTLNWFRSHHWVLESDKAELELFKSLLTEADSHLEVLKLFPSTHIVSAGLDPLKLGSQKLEDKLRRANVSVHHSHYPQKDHGFFCLDAEDAKEAIEDAAVRLAKAMS